MKPAAARILIVDDEPAISGLLARMLEHAGHECVRAASAEEARALIAATEFELMLCDVTMPGESGLDLVRDVLGRDGKLGTIMVTAHDDAPTIELALDLGAYGYVTKPFHGTEILVNVANALRRRTLEIDRAAQRELLEQTVAERTAELSDALGRLRERHVDTIRRLVAAAEARDGDTGRHIERMSELCALLAEQLGLEPARVDALHVVAPMHDIGKIGLPDRILCKPGPLTAEERRQMQTHTEIGRRLLSGSEDPLLSLAAEIAWMHHEHWDGSGYPRGIAGEEIPLEARIVAVADYFDALTNARVYRPAFSCEEALEMMRAGRETLFDPDVLDAFLSAVGDVVPVS